jgi:hypothetical protein
MLVECELQTATYKYAPVSTKIQHPNSQLCLVPLTLILSILFQ